MTNTNLEELKSELSKAIIAIDELKNQLIKKEREISEKSKLAVLGELGLGFAHEIKNPLSAITTYIDLLNNSLTEESQKNTLKKIKHSVLEIDIITNNMLFYTKELKAEISPVSLETLVEETLTGLEVAIKRKNIHVLKKIGNNSVNADYQLLKRSLVNLIVNAADANPDNGTICIETGMNDGLCFIAVEDSGDGVKHPDKLFQPFQTTKSKGMGLGLALVKKFMQAQGGSVGLNNPTKLKGARFELKLPARK
jgi:two-component system sensor histidine kinase AtoS